MVRSPVYLDGRDSVTDVGRQALTRSKPEEGTYIASQIVDLQGELWCTQYVFDSFGHHKECTERVVTADFQAASTPLVSTKITLIDYHEDKYRYSISSAKTMFGSIDCKTDKYSFVCLKDYFDIL